MNVSARFFRGEARAHSRRVRRGVWALLLMAGLSGPVLAEEDREVVVPVAVVFHAARPVSELALTRTALARLLPEAPLINGRLDDAAWKGASALTPLCRVGGTRIASPLTVVMVGYHGGSLYIGVQCDEPDPLRRTRRNLAGDRQPAEENCVQILLDPVLARGPVQVISVNPAGAVTGYTVGEGRRDTNWHIECVAAAAPTPTGWSVEVGIPRRALDNPINDIVGFNVVRRRPGAAGEPFAWNPAPAAYEHGEALGRLAFQRRLVTVQKVELGRPYVGENTFRMWLKNETAEQRMIRAGLATHVAGEAADTSRYVLRVPPGRARIYALSHRIRTAGPTDVALTLLDYEMGDPLVRVTRRGLNVSASPLVLTPKGEGNETGLVFDFEILLPKRDLKKVSLHAVFRNPATGRSLGGDRTRWATSRRGIVSVNGDALGPGTYRLEVALERDGKVLASTARDVVIGPPKSGK